MYFFCSSYICNVYAMYCSDYPGRPLGYIDYTRLSRENSDLREKGVILGP